MTRRAPLWDPRSHRQNVQWMLRIASSTEHFQTGDDKTTVAFDSTESVSATPQQPTLTTAPIQQMNTGASAEFARQSLTNSQSFGSPASSPSSSPSSSPLPSPLVIAKTDQMLLQPISSSPAPEKPLIPLESNMSPNPTVVEASASPSPLSFSSSAAVGEITNADLSTSTPIVDANQQSTHDKNNELKQNSDGHRELNNETDEVDDDGDGDDDDEDDDNTNTNRENERLLQPSVLSPLLSPSSSSSSTATAQGNQNGDEIHEENQIVRNLNWPQRAQFLRKVLAIIVTILAMTFAAIWILIQERVLDDLLASEGWIFLVSIVVMYGFYNIYYRLLIKPKRLGNLKTSQLFVCMIITLVIISTVIFFACVIWQTLVPVESVFITLLVLAILLLLTFQSCISFSGRNLILLGVVTTDLLALWFFLVLSHEFVLKTPPTEWTHLSSDSLDGFLTWLLSSLFVVYFLWVIHRMQDHFLMSEYARAAFQSLLDFFMIQTIVLQCSQGSTNCLDAREVITHPSRHSDKTNANSTTRPPPPRTTASSSPPPAQPIPDSSSSSSSSSSMSKSTNATIEMTNIGEHAITVE
jgi:hypothetical protein